MLEWMNSEGMDCHPGGSHPKLDRAAEYSCQRATCPPANRITLAQVPATRGTAPPSPRRSPACGLRQQRLGERTQLTVVDSTTARSRRLSSANLKIPELRSRGLRIHPLPLAHPLRRRSQLLTGRHSLARRLFSPSVCPSVPIQASAPSQLLAPTWPLGKLGLPVVQPSPFRNSPWAQINQPRPRVVVPVASLGLLFFSPLLFPILHHHTTQQTTPIAPAGLPATPSFDSAFCRENPRPNPRRDSTHTASNPRAHTHVQARRHQREQQQQQWRRCEVRVATAWPRRIPLAARPRMRPSRARWMPSASRRARSRTCWTP